MCRLTFEINIKTDSHLLYYVSQHVPWCHQKGFSAELKGWMVGLTQCGVFRLELITCTSWEVVAVLMFYFLCLFLWEAKGYKMNYGNDQIGMKMKWAIMVIGTLVMCTQTFL